MWQERQIIIYLLLLILFAFSGLKAKRTMFCSDFAFSKGAINFLICSIWKQTQLIFICLRLMAQIISETPQSSLVAFWDRWKKIPKHIIKLCLITEELLAFFNTVFISNSHYCFF